MRVTTSHYLPIFKVLVLLSAIIGSFSPALAVRRTVYDFTGDIRTDFVTLSAASATAPLRWKVLRNPALPGPNNAFIRIFDFGLGGDSITTADRDGDANSKFDLSVWRAGTYFSTAFPEGPGPIGPTTVTNWGQVGDTTARCGDYNGDGMDDYVIERDIGGVFNWFILYSSGGSRNVPFGGTAAGQTLFLFQGADFTGDAREELILARVNNVSGAVTWQVGDSITGELLLSVQWGNFNTDFIIQPDDYNGDGRADIVVWRAGGTGADARAWYIRDTATGNTLPSVIFGIGDPNFVTNDLPLRGDYDGDNRADIAVFRPGTREWFWINSTNGTVGSQQWGDPNDTALGTFFTF